MRIAQPLRVESGGLALMLPTSYDYATGIATDSLTKMSLSPSGRELDQSELDYVVEAICRWIEADIAAGAR